jgi:hypothetical protein
MRRYGHGVTYDAIPPSESRLSRGLDEKCRVRVIFWYDNEHEYTLAPFRNDVARDAVCVRVLLEERDAPAGRVRSGMCRRANSRTGSVAGAYPKRRDAPVERDHGECHEEFPIHAVFGCMVMTRGAESPGRDSGCADAAFKSPGTCLFSARVAHARPSW